jgi:hypothetical protein
MLILTTSKDIGYIAHKRKLRHVVIIIPSDSKISWLHWPSQTVSAILHESKKRMLTFIVCALSIGISTLPKHLQPLNAFNRAPERYHLNLPPLASTANNVEPVILPLAPQQTPPSTCTVDNPSYLSDVEPGMPGLNTPVNNATQHDTATRPDLDWFCRKLHQDPRNYSNFPRFFPKTICTGFQSRDPGAYPCRDAAFVSAKTPEFFLSIAYLY